MANSFNISSDCPSKTNLGLLGDDIFNTSKMTEDQARAIIADMNRDIAFLGCYTLFAKENEEKGMSAEESYMDASYRARGYGSEAAKLRILARQINRSISMEEVRRREKDKEPFDEDIVVTESEIWIRRLENVLNGIIGIYENSDAYIVYKLRREKEKQIMTLKNEIK